jgi:putative intracellular protease/amidase
MWKTLGAATAGLLVTTIAFVAWFYSLIDRTAVGPELEATVPADVPYIQRQLPGTRGRILAVVTSETEFAGSGKPTGYEHTELARAYYVFTVNGFEVDIASPRGGEPRAVIDDEDMAALDHAFLNDPVAMAKVQNTLALSDVNADEYAALFFVGGKGTMWDFPDNPDIQRLVSEHAGRGGLIGAVCHGPAALVNVVMPDGTAFLADKTVAGFTNEEELFLIPDAATVFPFLLEDGLRASGANVQVGLPYLENVAVSDGLVTGQNPWSVYATAERMVEQLGFAPVPRAATADENTVEVLVRYHQLGGVAAREMVDDMAATQLALNRNLLLIHGLVAGMQWRIKEALELLVLAQHTKSVTA